MADNLGIMLTELPEATNIGDDDLMYIVQENNSEKVKAKTIKDSLLGDFYGEASGNPASFADGAAAGLVECIADIEAAQDLHGYDKPWAGGTGKNIFGYEESATDETATYRSNINQQLIISKVTENEIKCNYNNGNYSEGYLVISGIDGTLSYSVSYTIKEKTVTYNPDIIKDTANSDSTKLVLKVRGNNGTNVVGNTEYVTFTNIQVESGTSITSFEPYSNICPISGSTTATVTISDGETSTTKTTPLGQTVYGGQLNVLTGELVVDRTFKTFNGSEMWYQRDTNTFYTAWTNDSLTPTANGIVDGVKNNIYEPILGNSASIVNYNGKSIFNSNSISNNNASLIIRDERFNDITNFKTELNNNNIEVVYPLATPQTVQLTPQEVNSLLGQNNISADTGDVDVVYAKSTAFIKPNPSGEADGYLSSIELSGEKFEIIKELPAFPSSNGNYKLKLSMSNGVPTLSWVSDT